MHSSLSRTPSYFAALSALALVLGAPLAARSAGDEAPGAGIGVARVSVIGGSVAVQRGDANTQTTAIVNAPVLGGDYVTTGDASRAEIQLDAASALRLSSNVQMRFTHLDAANREFALAEGTLELSLLRRGDGRLQIDTPSVSVAPRSAGVYRVTVDADGRSHVTVRSGRADVLSPQLVQELLPGTTIVASGNASNPSLRSVAAVAYDDFDRFNEERDRGEARALAAGTFDPAVSGLSDLDSYGRWVNDPAYGRVWVPNATAGWAPYRDGRWVWEDSFGWTWIGYEPWGWAPYHYGRWYHHAHYGWCWYPQRAVVVWRPALVAFLTFNGLGLGNIAWVPLAPYEPYYPWWGQSFGNTYVNNVTYVTNNYYGNPGHHHGAYFYGNARHNGVTYLPQHRFAQGDFMRPLRANPSQLRSVEVVRGPLRVVPGAGNLRFSDRPVGTQLALRTAVFQKQFAGDAAPVVRVPFQQQRTAVATVTHEGSGVRNATGNRRVEVIEGSTITHPPSDPWSRFGHYRGLPAGTHATTVTPAANVESARPLPGPAWNRFDAAGAPSHAVMHHDPVGNDVPRGHDAPIHRSLPVEPPRHNAPPRSYEPVHPESHVVPAAQAARAVPAHTEHVPADRHIERHQPR